MKNSIQGKRFHEIDFFISRVFLAYTFLKFWPTVQVHKHVSCAQTRMFFLFNYLEYIKTQFVGSSSKVGFSKFGIRFKFSSGSFEGFEECYNCKIMF